MHVILGFFISYNIFYIFTMFFLNLLCNNTFEQGDLKPWRYRNAVIIIIIIIILLSLQPSNACSLCKDHQCML